MRKVQISAWVAANLLSVSVVGAQPAISGEQRIGAVVNAAIEAREQNVAASRSEYLIVWTDRRNGADGVYASRVSPTGAVLDPGGIPISEAGSHPAVAFNG